MHPASSVCAESMGADARQPGANRIAASPTTSKPMALCGFLQRHDPAMIGLNRLAELHMFRGLPSRYDRHIID
jgi:hypothetical protein